MVLHLMLIQISTLFDGIIPCGIKEKSVTSLQNELGRAIEINEVKTFILEKFTEVFDYSPAEKKDLDEFLISEIIDQ